MANAMHTKTELSELGEFGLIRHLTQNIVLKNESTLTGVGDDCAVLDYKNKKIVVTTDLLTEGVHFNLMYVPLKHLGYKAVTVNLSDVYAMNADNKNSEDNRENNRPLVPDVYQQFLTRNAGYEQ